MFADLFEFLTVDDFFATSSTVEQSQNSKSQNLLLYDVTKFQRVNIAWNQIYS
jgi:hypothetical protein